MNYRKTLLLFVCAFVVQTFSYAQKYDYPQLMTKAELLANRGCLGGVYRAYPYGSILRLVAEHNADNKGNAINEDGQPLPALTLAPEGYTPFYISHYGRHGSRYQPNDSRYANTLKRLKDGHDKGVLTPLGEDLFKRIQILCDSCLGHGGLLTAKGARQHEAIARRMYHNYPEVFSKGGHISARASVVTRCGQSMRAFLKGLNAEAAAEKGKTLDIKAEIDSAYMSYIAYDTPEMRKLSSKDAEWQKTYNKFMLKNVNQKAIMKRIFTDLSDIDVLQTTIDLYWLVVGMQNLDLPFTLDDIFTPEELFKCYQCVNYRMYICNGNSPISENIPAQSASTLLKNIIETADTVIYSHLKSFKSQLSTSDFPVATLRFGHDSNTLRLLALMRLHNCAIMTPKVEDGWKVWQECMLSPMAANLQLIFYRNSKNDILVKILLNEHETLLDTDKVRTFDGCYYRWSDLRQFWQSQIVLNTSKTDFIEPVQ